MISSSDDEVEAIMKKKMNELQKRAEITAKLKKITEPIPLNDSNFDLEKNKFPLMLVDFWATWCGPCKIISPIIEQLAKEYSGKIVFAKINVDENHQLSNRFGIQSIPTMIVFRYGEVVDRIIGALPKVQIENKLKIYLEE